MLKNYITTLEEDDDEDMNVGQTKRVYALVSPLCEDIRKHSWETASFSSHEELSNLIQDNSKTLSRIKMVFGKFAQFNLGATVEQTE